MFPAGRPDLPLAPRHRVKAGNLLATWTAAVYRRCVALDIAVWVENPDSSWMWRIRLWKRIKENLSNIYGEWGSTIAGLGQKGENVRGSSPTRRCEDRFGDVLADMNTGDFAARMVAPLGPS